MYSPYGLGTGMPSNEATPRKAVRTSVIITIRATVRPRSLKKAFAERCISLCSMMKTPRRIKDLHCRVEVADANR